MDMMTPGSARHGANGCECGFSNRQSVVEPYVMDTPLEYGAEETGKHMSAQRIAIIGLGRIGSAFLTDMLARRAHGIDLVCAAEQQPTAGRQAAEAAGIPSVPLMISWPSARISM
jgi:lactate dehydrogenase-like 2-hydroxyacid dehydrogenase